MKADKLDKLTKIVHCSKEIMDCFTMIQGLGTGDGHLKDKLIEEIIEFHRQMKGIDL